MSRGSIKATRLEPETGRLQYFLERPNAHSDWHYADDSQFTREYGDLIKKFINNGRREARQRAPPPPPTPPPLSLPKLVKKKGPIGMIVPKKKVAKAPASTASDDSSIRPVPITRIPVKRFRQMKAQATAKLAKKAKEAASDGSSALETSTQSSSSTDDGNARYMLTSFLKDRNAGLLLPAAKKRPASPGGDNGLSKMAKKALPTSAGSSKPRSSSGVQEIMRAKIMKARDRQLQKSQHRSLLNSLSADKLKPVSLKLSQPLHQSLIRSPTLGVSSKKPNVNSRKFSSSPRASSSHQLLRQHHISVHSFLSQTTDNFSNVETSESASTSNSSFNNGGGGHYSSIRRGPKRQAASGQLSQLRYSQIVLRHRPGWTQLWLFSTTRMQNAFSPTLMDELKTALKACIADPDTSLILISSSGPTFSSGIDLNYLLDAKDPAAAARRMSQAIVELCQVLVSCPKPIFVAVNGPCVGLGVALCCLADCVIATEKAVFSTPYAQLGHVPEGALTTTLQQSIGRAMASDMLFTGRRLTAIEALRAGLVSRILWPTNFVQELIVRLDIVAANNSPALDATKMLMRSAANDDSTQQSSSALAAGSIEKLPPPAGVSRALESESELFELFWSSPESRTAMRRYVEAL